MNNTKNRKIGFIVLIDLVTTLKNKGFKIGYGRGSAAGSLIGYLLNIHDIDPIKHDLYFERFLNSERMDYPDIDIDLSPKAREYAIKYLKEKYPNKVATFAVQSKLGIKGSVADSLRILGYSTKIIKEVSEDIEENYNGELSELKSLKHILKDIPDFEKGINKLKGENVNYSQHVSAVLVDNEEYNYDSLEEKNNLRTLNINDKNINKIK